MTKRLESRREALQRDYMKGDIDEREFLITIGSLTGKKVGHLRTPATGPEGTGGPPAIGSDGGLPSQVISEENSSLRFKIISKIPFLKIFIFFSETYFITADQSSGDEVSGLPPTQPLNSRHPALRIGRSAKEKQPKPKCSFCKRGFQFWRVPQLQIKCTDCQNFVHLRCIKTLYDEEKYVCQLCSPSGVDSSVASPAPATVQCSLDERSDIPPDITEPLSGEY